MLSFPYLLAVFECCAQKLFFCAQHSFLFQYKEWELKKHRRQMEKRKQFLSLGTPSLPPLPSLCLLNLCLFFFSLSLGFSLSLPLYLINSHFFLSVFLALLLYFILYFSSLSLSLSLSVSLFGLFGLSLSLF